VTDTLQAVRQRRTHLTIANKGNLHRRHSARSIVLQGSYSSLPSSAMVTNARPGRQPVAGCHRIGHRANAVGRAVQYVAPPAGDDRGSTLKR
jgi:hypothetical protein